MKQSLNAIIVLQFPANPQLQQLFQDVYQLLKTPLDETAEGELSENKEMKYYASIREFFPFDKEQASALIEKYSSSLEQVIHAATDQDLLNACNNLPWHEERIEEIVKICAQYAAHHFNSTQNKKLDNQKSKKNKSQDPLQYIRISESQTYLQEYAHAQKQFLEIIKTFTLKNSRLIPRLGAPYVKRGHERSDVLQYGLMGLRRAAIKYDWKLGYKFSTYATWWIRQELQRSSQEEESLIRLPVHMHDTKQKVIRLISKFYNEHHRNPSSEEIAQILKIPLLKVQILISHQEHLTSLYQQVGDNEESSLIDFINGSDEHQLSGYVHVPPSQEKAADQKYEQKRIHQHLKKLHPREEKIIHLRYGIKGNEELTLEEVGKQFNLTRERIRQIESKALHKLGKSIAGRSYQPLPKRGKQEMMEDSEEEQEVA